LRRALAISVGALLAAALAGCSGTSARAPRSEFIPFTAEQLTVLQAQRTHLYRIQEGDLLKVQFAYEKPLNQEGIIVLPDGSVSLIGIDNIRLAGLTIAQADSVVTAAYSKEYREPALSIMIQETQGRRIFVLGEVSDPGLYRVTVGGMDVMNAITMASGFTDDAAREATLVVRTTMKGYEFYEVDLAAFGTDQFMPSATMELLPYDIVYVPRSRQGDFGYFTRSILAGLSYATGVGYDLYSIVTGRSRF
jgi:protein involved in polysaccharide export with SLBB domain